MPLDALAARIRGEYDEMPGLQLTLAQACRLWQLDASTCETLLEQLVREAFLYKTDAGAYIAHPATSGRQPKAQLRRRLPLPRSA
jgi:DNA-binding IclR family transcriptional regulator